MDILGGEVDFSVDGLMGCFEAEFTLAFVNVIASCEQALIKTNRKPIQNH